MHSVADSGEKKSTERQGGLERLVEKLFTTQTSYDIYFVEKGLTTPQAVKEACRRTPRWLDLALLVAVATVVSIAAGGIRLTIQGELAMPTLLLYAHVFAVYAYLAFLLFRWAFQRTISR